MSTISDNVPQVGDIWQHTTGLRLSWRVTFVDGWGKDPRRPIASHPFEVTLQRADGEVSKTIRVRQLIKEYRRTSEGLAVTASDAQPECEGFAASWCARCGTCTCTMSQRELGDYREDCPLHGPDSQHAFTLDEVDAAADDLAAQVNHLRHAFEVTDQILAGGDIDEARRHIADVLSGEEVSHG